MKTCMYLRKSRAEDLSDSTGDTLRRHRETLEETARAMQLTICGVYEEVVSGEDLYARPEMLRLLRDVKDGVCEAVLCMDIDRLGRGTMSQQGVILETFKEAGVRIITPQKTYDLQDEMDEDYTELQTFFARKELKLIKKRMRRGVERMKKPERAACRRSKSERTRPHMSAKCFSPMQTARGLRRLPPFSTPAARTPDEAKLSHEELS